MPSLTFNSSGTWTAPPGVTSVLAECIGGGGGGGADDTSQGAGGGGGGAYASKTITVTPGTGYTVTVGTGGAGGSGSGNAGSTGNDSWFSTSGTVLAKAGTGGNTSGGGHSNGGAAASCIGTVKHSGGDGAIEAGSGNSGGGGGGSGGSAAAGNAGASGNGSGGAGGVAVTGGGAGGVGGTANNAGVVGGIPGGGGGGSGNGGTQGGTGGVGQVLLTWTGFVEFYMQTTGSDMNGGSSNADAAAFGKTNGNWNATTGVYTVPSGNPTSTVNIGDWASVFIDGATVPVFIGQVTKVTSTTITVSLTIKLGTAPSTNSTLRSINVGGAWASFGICTNVFGSGNTLAITTRINVKAGTYANTTTSRTFSIIGTTTMPFWIRGYNTTIGDIEVTNSLTKPVLSFTTGSFTMSGAHHYVSNIDFTSARTAGPGFNPTGQFFRMDRCRVVNTGANALGRAILFNANGFHISRCYFKATSTATSVMNFAANGVVRDSVFQGGGHHMDVTTAGLNLFFTGNVYDTPGTDGINISAAPAQVHVNACSFVGGGNGVNWAALPTGTGSVSNCVFNSCTTAGINNSSGTNTNTIERFGNVHYNNGTNELGMGDSPEFNHLTDTASSFTSSTDFTLAAASAGRSVAQPNPGTYENVSYSSYGDTGAVRHADPAAAAAGAIFII